MLPACPPAGLSGLISHSLIVMTRGISVNAQGFRRGDDPAPGTVDGKYSSPPKANPAPRMSMLLSGEQRAPKMLISGVNLASNFDIGGGGEVDA